MSTNKFAYVSLAKIIYVILLIVNCMYVSDWYVYIPCYCGIL